MAGRRLNVLDVREMVRRFRLGQSDRQVAHDMSCSRHTAGKYRLLAQGQGWLTRPDLPTPAEIDGQRAAVVTDPPDTGPDSSVEPHRARVVELRAKGVEMIAIWQILKDERQFTGSYSSVRRFVRTLEPRTPDACVRVETPPGEEAQVDFGYAGALADPVTGEMRRAWVFVMTLAFSRHQYAEIVFDQTVSTWLALHVRAFEFFGGVPARIVPDNLKAAVVRASFHDPQIQHAYRELAEHYSFTVSPCRPKTPRHKGKVESGVRYVKRNALAGREFKDVREANAYLLDWVRTRAGVRDHGTTHEAPLVRFERERPHLKPLPAVRYELAVWKEAKLHPDCHVVFEQAYYSAPHRLVGQKLLVRATPDRVEIYFRYERVATHARAKYRGQRVSSILHYPPDRVAGLLVTPMRVKEQARTIGESTSQLIEEMLSDQPVDRLRPAQGILTLVKRYGPERLEAACRRALVFNQTTYRAVSTILAKGMEYLPLPPEVRERGPVPRTSAFARPVHEIAVGL